MTLSDFIQQRTVRNAWCSYRHMEVYVRWALRFIDGASRETFDLSNCTVQPRYRGRGEYKSMVDLVFRMLPPGQYVFAENINEPRLIGYYERNGWTIDPTYKSIIGDPCYFKKVPDVVN